MKRILVLIMLVLSVKVGLAQRVLYDRTKDGVRTVAMTGKTFDIHMRSHKMSLTGVVYNDETVYTIDVYTYVEISENSQLIFTLFDGEEIALNAVNKSDGYMIMIPPLESMLPVIPFPNNTGRYEISNEQLNRIFASGIQGMKISSGSDSRHRTWKKDKLGIFLKNSFDKLQLRLEK